MSLKNYCVEIFSLLISVGEDSWSKEFASLITNFDFLEKKALIQRIALMYGGLGSFNDLVLYKDGKVCFEENDKLDELRKGLYVELGRTV